MTTLALRSSLEVTDHPRSVECTQHLLAWLVSHQLDDALHPTERDILETPRVSLIRSQLLDATRSAEGACLLAWVIGHCEPPPALEPADVRPLVQTFRILGDDVDAVVDSVILRPISEIEHHYVEILLTLCEQRVRRLADTSAQTLLRRLEMGRIAELGLSASDELCLQVRDFVESLSANEKRAIARIQFARSIAVRWLFGSRDTYYES